MAQDTRPTSFDENAVETFEQRAGGAEFLAYGSAPSMAMRKHSLPEDMPLFLSNDADSVQDAEEPKLRRFGSGGGRNFDQPAVWPRFAKAGILVAAAAGIAFAIVSVENPLGLFSNAKASLIGATAVQPNAAQKSAAEPIGTARAASVQPAPANQSMVGVGAPQRPAQAAPTRDEIALALRAAHQSPPEIRPPAAAAPPVRRLDADELATLLKRANGLIAIGDIAPARLLLERAADAQEASAAFLLAQTYDPAVLGKQDSRSVTADPAKARDWYQKAARFGSQDAQQRLSRIQN